MQGKGGGFGSGWNVSRRCVRAHDKRAGDCIPSPIVEPILRPGGAFRRVLHRLWMHLQTKLTGPGSGAPVAVAELQQAQAVLEAADLHLPQAGHLDGALRALPQRKLHRARLQQVLRACQTALPYAAVKPAGSRRAGNSREAYRCPERVGANRRLRQAVVFGSSVGRRQLP